MLVELCMVECATRKCRENKRDMYGEVISTHASTTSDVPTKWADLIYMISCHVICHRIIAVPLNRCSRHSTGRGKVGLSGQGRSCMIRVLFAVMALRLTSLLRLTSAVPMSMNGCPTPRKTPKAKWNEEDADGADQACRHDFPRWPLSKEFHATASGNLADRQLVMERCGSRAERSK